MNSPPIRDIVIVASTTGPDGYRHCAARRAGALRILPRTWHPAVDQLSEAELGKLMENVERVIAACVDAMPMHQQFIARHCAAV